jgi:TonB family protein
MAAPAAAGAATPAAPPAIEAPASLPSDPKELMLLAAKSNGLTGDDVKPWHLKASYKLLDENGNTKDQGTFEEFWAAADKFKRTFTGAAFKYSIYGTEKGVLFSGDQSLQFRREDELLREILNPLPSPQLIEKNSYVRREIEMGGVKFACLSLKDVNGNPYGTNWCLDPESPILRITVPQMGDSAVHNDIVRFQGRFVPGNLRLLQAGKPVFTAHLDSLEPLAVNDESAILPSPDAVPQRIKVISIAGGIAQGLLVKMVPPEYPIYAKDAKISGTVVLQANIDKDGHIADLQVVSGPSQLQRAAMDAVKKWAYRPFLLNNEPVEVKTTINVIFRLGN